MRMAYEQLQDVTNEEIHEDRMNQTSVLNDSVQHSIMT